MTDIENEEFMYIKDRLLSLEAINEALDALNYFHDTGDRSKFREWKKKWDWNGIRIKEGKTI